LQTTASVTNCASNASSRYRATWRPCLPRIFPIALWRTLFHKPPSVRRHIPPHHRQRAPVQEQFVSDFRLHFHGFPVRVAVGNPSQLKSLHPHRADNQEPLIHRERAHFIESRRLRSALHASIRPYNALRQRRSERRPLFHGVRV